MLSKLLKKSECAKCQICCGFDSSDIWETPVISKELKANITNNFLPKQEYLDLDTHYLFKMEKESDKDLYFCPALDHSKGCTIGKDKPFDCKIWPLRIMKLDNRLVITLSPVCPVVQKNPLCDIQQVATELAPMIFEYAEREPFAVKEYISGYPILVVK